MVDGNNEIKGQGEDKNNEGVNKNTKVAGISVESSRRQDRTLAVGSSPDRSLGRSIKRG